MKRLIILILAVFLIVPGYSQPGIIPLNGFESKLSGAALENSAGISQKADADTRIHNIHSSCRCRPAAERHTADTAAVNTDNRISALKTVKNISLLLKYRLLDKFP